jgi:serine/threonine-protein kinase RsbW
MKRDTGGASSQGRMDISNAAVRVLRDHSGRGPTSARTSRATQVVLSLAPNEDAPGRARGAVARLGASEEMLADLSLLTSELVTNAVVHAQLDPEDLIDFSATFDGTRVRVDVRDAGRGSFAITPREPVAQGGRGLFIVDQLADRWGIDRDGGTRVWAELTAVA